MTSVASRPRRFAPLRPNGVSSPKNGNAPILKGVVFDVDGTLCEPQNYMFAEMRAALGISKPTDILDHIHSLPNGEQEAAQEKIREIERRAMRAQRPQKGLLALMEYLTSRGVRKGICTRNFDIPVNHLLTTFLPEQVFWPVITREFKPPKPDPAGILHIAAQWELDDGANSLIMVGDSVDDMAAGHAAGAATVLLVNDTNRYLAEHEHTDLCITSLDELIEVLENGFIGQVGQGDEKPNTKEPIE